MSKGQPERLPTEITVGDRTYEILGFLKGDEKMVTGNVMVGRSRKMGANLGEEDGQYLLRHQQDIPSVLRNRISFTFPEWHPPRLPGIDHTILPEFACTIFWLCGRWVLSSSLLDRDSWDGLDRVIRRK